MQLVFSHETYRVSKCFSEHDIPRGPAFLGMRGWIVEMVAGKKLWCHRVSKSGSSGWFRVDIDDLLTVDVVIHSRFLERVGFTVQSTYTFDYYEATPESALAAARMKFPDADHRRVY